MLCSSRTSVSHYPFIWEAKHNAICNNYFSHLLFLKNMSFCTSLTCVSQSQGHHSFLPSFSFGTICLLSSGDSLSTTSHHQGSVLTLGVLIKLVPPWLGGDGWLEEFSSLNGSMISPCLPSHVRTSATPHKSNQPSPSL